MPSDGIGPMTRSYAPTRSTPGLALTSADGTLCLTAAAMLAAVNAIGARDGDRSR